MSILAVCGAAVLTAVFAVTLRTQNPHSALLLSLASGAVIILSILKNMPDMLIGVRAILADGGIGTDEIAILFKVIGICFVTEFTCDCVTEAGMLSLSTNISFAGKIIVLMTALPLFEKILDIISSLGS